MSFRLVPLNLLEFVWYSLGVAVVFVVSTRVAIGSSVLPLSAVAVVEKVLLLFKGDVEVGFGLVSFADDICASCSELDFLVDLIAFA
jgi:hypothetical protein